MHNGTSLRILWISGVSLCAIFSAACGAKSAPIRKPTVVVLSVASDNTNNAGSAKTLRKRIVGGVKAGNFPMASRKKYSRVAKKLDAEAIKSRNVAKVAAEIGVNAVVTSSLKKKGDRYRLRISVRNGENGKRIDRIEFRLKRPRLGRKNRGKLNEWLAETLSTITYSPQIVKKKKKKKNRRGREKRAAKERKAEERAKKREKEERRAAKREAQERQKERAEEERQEEERQKEREEEESARREEKKRKAEEKKRRAEEKKRRAEEKKRKAEEKKRRAEEKKRAAEKKKREAAEKKRRAEARRRAAEKKKRDAEPPPVKIKIGDDGQAIDDDIPEGL